MDRLIGFCVDLVEALPIIGLTIAYLVVFAFCLKLLWLLWLAL